MKSLCRCACLVTAVLTASGAGAQTTGTCCGKTVELSKQGAGLVRSKECFDCKAFLESGAKTWEEYACKKIQDMGPMGRVTFATQCGVVVVCPATIGDGTSLRDQIVKQLQDQGAVCAECPDIKDACPCPGQAVIHRLILDAEARLAAIEQSHQQAAALRTQCQRSKQLLRDVCVKARQTEYAQCLQQHSQAQCDADLDRECPPVPVACAAELATENRWNWNLMLLRQDLRELRMLDFSRPGPDGTCVDFTLEDRTSAPGGREDIDEKACPSWMRAQFTYIRKKDSGEPIGRVFTGCTAVP